MLRENKLEIEAHWRRRNKGEIESDGNKQGKKDGNRKWLGKNDLGKNWWNGEKEEKERKI